MVVYYVCEVISREAVCLDKYLVIEILVGESDVAVYEVMLGGGTRQRHLLSDDIGHACIKILLDLFS